jgi:medium-chain acyl-[acyl-carrier-protein] hydrolase
MQVIVEPLVITTTVRTAEVDIDNRMKLSSLFLLMQETAIRHSDMLNFGIDYMASHNCFWVLSRVKVELRQLPSSESPFTITTWPVGTDKLFAIRDFVFSDGNGHQIGAATTSWLVVDKTLNRPHRPDMFGHLEYPDLQRPIATLAPKIHPHPELNLSHSQTARYGNIDINRHVNNATYVEWMFDTLPYSHIPQAPLSFALNFNMQIRWGDTVDLYSYENGEGTIYFEVRKEGHSAAAGELRKL